jgi:hypothetical protein
MESRKNYRESVYSITDIFQMEYCYHLQDRVYLFTPSMAISMSQDVYLMVSVIWTKNQVYSFVSSHRDLDLTVASERDPECGN